MEIPSDEIDEIDAKVATFSLDANDEPDEKKAARCRVIRSEICERPGGPCVKG